MSDMNFTIGKAVAVQPNDICITHIAKMDGAEGTLKHTQQAQIIVCLPK